MNRLRMAVPEDAARLAEIYRPSIEETGVSFEEVAPAPSEMRERVSKTLVRFPWLVFEVDGLVTGYAYASRHRERPAYTWSAEVSIYVDELRHRAGVGRQLYTTLFDILRIQGIQSVFAGIIEPNPKSFAFHYRMGFVDVGRYQHVGFKRGQWRDTVWLQLDIGTHPSPPPAFRPITEVLDLPAAAALLAGGAAQAPTV